MSPILSLIELTKINTCKPLLFLAYVKLTCFHNNMEMSSDLWGFVIDAAYCLLDCGPWLVNGLPCGGYLGNTRLSSNPLVNGESLLASMTLCQWISVSRITLLYSRWFGRDQITSSQKSRAPASFDPLTASSKSASPPYFWELVNSSVSLPST